MDATRKCENRQTSENALLSIVFFLKVGQYPPQPEKDPHWDVGVPSELPYTVASLPFRGIHAETGAEDLKIPLSDQRPVYTSTLNINAVRINIDYLILVHLLSTLLTNSSSSKVMEACKD